MLPTAPSPRPARRRLARTVTGLLASALLAAPTLLASGPAPASAQTATAETCDFFAPRCVPEWATAPARVVPVPSSIDATGARDVSDALDAFLRTVPDGSTIRFAANGRYRMEKTLFIRNRNQLTFDGNGATIFATTEGDLWRAHLKTEGGSNIVFRDLTVKGANPYAGPTPAAFRLDREHQHAFDVRSVKNYALFNVTASDTFGDLVQIGRRYADVWSENVIVRDSNLMRSGRQGIALTAIRNVVIEDNRLDQISRAIIDFEPDHAPGFGVDSAIVRNNEIGKGRLQFIAAVGQGPVNNITIEGNNLTGTAMQMMVKERLGGTRYNWKVLNNVSDHRLGNPHGSAMRFYRVNGLEVRGNRQPLLQGFNMVLANVHESCAVTVRSNWIPHGIGDSRVEGTCPK